MEDVGPVAKLLGSEELASLAHFTAVSKTNSVDDTVQNLVLHSLQILNEESDRDIGKISSLISSIFGIILKDHELESAINKGLSDRKVVKEGSNFRLSASSL
ncbi:MAG: hypothetical protein ACYTDT_12120 [Planctomycetota bacterium]|jgi:hypothetical protein